MSDTVPDRWALRPADPVTNHPILAWVIGATGAGKTTFLTHAKKYPGVGLVEVGKMMRAKYPPEYFKGQAAPKHTETEAWQMCLDSIAAQPKKKLILIDGQPRTMDQLPKTLKMGIPARRCYVHLWAPADVREGRLLVRDNNDPAKLELAMKRLHGDVPDIYNILSSLHVAGERIIHRATHENFTNGDHLLAEITQWYGGLFYLSTEFP